MRAIAVIAGGVPFLIGIDSAGAQSFGIVEPIEGLQADCSFVGIDAYFQAPVREGSGILSMVESMDTYDDQPYFYSSLAIHSCQTGSGISGYWDRTERAPSILEKLRASALNYSNWATNISDALAIGNGEIAIDIDPRGQMECACQLPYGMGATQ